MTLKDPRASALALAEPVPADAEARIDHEAVQRGARPSARARRRRGRRASRRRLAGSRTPTPSCSRPALSSHHLSQRRGLRRADRRASIPFHSLCMHHLLPFQGWRTSAICRASGSSGSASSAASSSSSAAISRSRSGLRRRSPTGSSASSSPRASGSSSRRSTCALRGVQKLGAMTVTSALRGLVRDDVRTRQEFLALTKRGSYDD